MKNLACLAVTLILIAGCADRAAPPVAAKVTSETPVASKTETPAVTAKPESIEKITKTDAEWSKQLTPEQFRILRQKGTERPFTNEYDHHFEPGSYSCAACGLELFESETKFNSGCGWPAFYAAKAGDRVQLHRDTSHGMIRTEVTCSRCGSHLGHVFDDAPDKPTGQRYCINSVSLKFSPKDGKSQDAKK